QDRQGLPMTRAVSRSSRRGDDRNRDESLQKSSHSPFSISIVFAQGSVLEAMPFWITRSNVFVGVYETPERIGFGEVTFYSERGRGPVRCNQDWMRRRRRPRLTMP